MAEINGQYAWPCNSVDNWPIAVRLDCSSLVSLVLSPSIYSLGLTNSPGFWILCTYSWLCGMSTTSRSRMPSVPTSTICLRGYRGYVSFYFVRTVCADGVSGNHPLLCKSKVVCIHPILNLLCDDIMVFRMSTLELYERKLLPERFHALGWWYPVCSVFVYRIWTRKALYSVIAYRYWIATVSDKNKGYMLCLVRPTFNSHFRERK